MVRGPGVKLTPGLCFFSSIDSQVVQSAMTPILRRSKGIFLKGMAETSSPSTTTLPWVGSVSLIISFMRVVLPDPEGPEIITNSPSPTAKETLSKVRGKFSGNIKTPDSELTMDYQSLATEGKDEKSKTEIILLITPRIIKEHTSPEPGQNEFWIGIDGDSYKRLPTPINETNVPILPTPQINDQLKQDDKNQNINFQIR